MSKRNIIVIGASAGGFEAIKQLTYALPKDLDASIFIVWHMAADVHGVLPLVINRESKIPAAHAVDGEAILPNRIYVASPDHHLLLEEGRVRVTHGPKENRFRPAVDPLFRSAAHAYSNRVIGIILSGALDDGTAGLWAIKNKGGIAMVQDPMDAEVPSMPQSALREVKVDYKVPVSEMAALLVKLCNEQVSQKEDMAMEEYRRTELEIRIALEDSAFEGGVMMFGELTPFTCPDCHGVLMGLKEGDRTRFRCHTGHAFSADSLLAAVTEKIEDSLWNAIRGVEESIMLLNHIGDHFAEMGQTKLAAMYFKKAKDADVRAKLVRQAVLANEQLTQERIQQLSEEQ